jgi:carbamoyltransferase
MIILGLAGALEHDASAALLVDGELAAAVEEERFVRDRHAKGRMPIESARYCLAAAGVSPRDVDVVAFPYALIPLGHPARWHHARRNWYAPARSLGAIFAGNLAFRRKRERVLGAGAEIGLDWQRTEFVAVEHHLAHAASAYLLSGFEGKTAILGLDGRGEYASAFFGRGENGRIHTLRELYDPDSIAGLYGALTEYLGFERLDGESSVMDLAAYGDSTRSDLSRLVRCRRGELAVDTRYVNTAGSRRYRRGVRRFPFSTRLVEWLGPPRTGDALAEPWVHYAAAVQRLYEETVLALVDAHLATILEETGVLVFAGGGALNASLNGRILARGDVERLHVPPAAGDAGTSLGAAAFVASARGERLAPQRHVYLGPGYSTAQCIDVLEVRSERPRWRRLDDVPRETAAMLAAGHPVAWFQGRMEFGPRALGARSVLGCPTVAGMAGRVNAAIKRRPPWRTYGASVLDRSARDFIGTDHPAPFMTTAFDVSEAWRARVPEVVRRDGRARVHVVERGANPRYYALLEALEALTGSGVVLNTSFNGPGEPIVCTPADALHLFYSCDLEYMVLEDLLVTKT